MTSYPLVNRILATLRMAELGFLGVRVITCKQTPRRKGEFSKAGDFDFRLILLRPFRTSWLMVGILLPVHVCSPQRLEKRSADISKRTFGCNKYLSYFQ